MAAPLVSDLVEAGALSITVVVLGRAVWQRRQQSNHAATAAAAPTLFWKGDGDAQDGEAHKDGEVTAIEPLTGPRLIWAVVIAAGLVANSVISLANAIYRAGQPPQCHQHNATSLDIIITSLALVFWISRFIPISYRHVLYRGTLFLHLGFTTTHLPIQIFRIPVPGSTTCSNDLILAQSWLALAILLCFNLTPRVHQPCQPDSPRKPAPGQEASMISFLITFSWLHETLRRAWRTPLRQEDMPELPDYDTTEYSVAILPAGGDGAGFAWWRTLVVLWDPVWHQGLYSALVGLCYLAGAYSLQRLLEIIEDPATSTGFAPWAYVLAFASAMLFSTLCLQGFFFLGIRYCCRLQAATIQALFNKTLAFRFGTSAGTSNEGAKDGKSSSMVGQVNNLMSADVQNFHLARDCWQLCFCVPLTIIGALVLLQRNLGWVAYIGAGIVVTFCLMVRILVKLSSAQQTKYRAAADARVGATAEFLSSIRMVKYFGWEDLVAEKLIAPKRAEEVNLAFKRNLIEVVLKTCYATLPMLNLLVVFTLYIRIQGRRITPSVAFSTIAYYAFIQLQVECMVEQSVWLSNFLVSWRRIRQFLANDNVVESGEKTVQSDVLAYKNANLSWNESTNAKVFDVQSNQSVDAETDALLAGNRSDYRTSKAAEGFHLTNLDIQFEAGSLTVITGSIASGKTSFLMGLLGELHIESGQVFLPRHLGVSYVPQVAWLLNATIKDNILFGCETPFDAARYQATIYACGLEPDLNMLAAGDMTEIGEKGLTLSGGQQQRVSLARAIYANTKIVLLDDIFSALDATTAKHVYEKCICGSLLAGRTVVLVTHQISLVARSADRIINLHHGRIDKITNAKSETSSLTSARTLIVEDTGSASATVQDVEDETIESKTSEALGAQVASKTALGKLVMAEETGQGRASKRYVWVYLGYMSGLRLAFVLVFGVVATVFKVLGPLSLGLVKAADPKLGDSTHDFMVWLISHGGILVGIIVSYVLYNVLAMYSRREASLRIHECLVAAVLNAPLRFFDTNPTGRILNRFSNDMASIDHNLPHFITRFYEIVLDFVVCIALVVLIIPPMIVVCIFAALGTVVLGEIYSRASISIRRLLSIAASPMISNFNDALNGNVIIRAFNRQSFFYQKNIRHADAYMRALKSRYAINRWIGNWLSIPRIPLPLAAGLLGLQRGLDARSMGLVLSVMTNFARVMDFNVRMFNDMEDELVTMQRVSEYISEIDQEALATDEYEPPASWPTSGALDVRGMSVRYHPDGPDVLRDVTFSIKPGERVGVVGATGVGKSSLAVSLLRFTHMTSGSVFLDGRDITRTNLHTLRRRITFIPQDPSCLRGTVRFNLDPFGEVDDTELNEALVASGLIDEDEMGSSPPTHAHPVTPTVSRTQRHITLDTPISHGGENLSQGQRQLLAFARALVRRSRLIILDEATSYTDARTDAKVQATMRSARFGRSHARGGGGGGPGTTTTSVLTIAHRLRTIMGFDRILVLGQHEDGSGGGGGGHVVEFDTPRVLLRREGGALARFARDTGEFDELLALADGGS